LGSLFGNAQESSCQVDGIPTNCDLAMRLKNNGSAMQCPYNDCGPQRRDFVNPDGERFSFLTLPFMAFGDDTFGYFLGGWAELGTPQEQAEILRAQTIGGIDGARTTGNNFQQQLPGPKPAPAPTPVPHVPPCYKNGVKANQEELDALAEKLGGKITYTKPGKPDSEAIITDIKDNPNLLNFERRLRDNGWSRIYGNMSPEHWGGIDWKNTGKYGNWYHITVFPIPSSSITDWGVYHDQIKAPPKKITIHCENGNPQDPLHER
jgi:hypothetical protein